MRRIVVLILGICLYGACSEKKPEEIRTFEIDVNKQYKPCFNDYFELKEVIHLETTDSSILGNMRKVVAVEDHLFISTWKTSYVYIFRRDGKFLRVIDKQGRGPEEYAHLTDFMVNSSPREIIIYDYIGRLSYYDWEGNFLRTRKAKPAWNNVEQLPDGGWLANQGLLPLDSVNYVYQALTPDMKFVKGVEKLSALKNMKYLYFSTSSIFKDKEKYFVIPCSSNTIYEYDWKDTLFIPRYEFRIQGYPMIASEEVTDELMEKGFWQDCYLLCSEFIGEKTVVVKALLRRNGRAHLFLVDKEKNDVRKMECRDRDNRLPIQRGDLQQCGFDGKLLFFAMASSIVGRDYDDKNSMGYKLSREMSEEDNPVLLLYGEK